MLKIIRNISIGMLLGSIMSLIVILYNHMVRDFKTLLKPIFTVEVENTIAIMTTITLVTSAVILISILLKEELEK